MEACRKGPFKRSELYDHLKSSHDVIFSGQVFLDHVLGAVNIRRDQTLKMLIDEEVDCPLRDIGCNFRCHSTQLQQHLGQHIFVDPSNGQVITGWEHSDLDIRTQTGRLDSGWAALGFGTCPICRNTIFNLVLWATLPVRRILHKQFLAQHLRSHSEDEQATHAKEIAEVMYQSLTD
jgi:hypothetical protein